jgi:hypothetical protein
MTITTTTRNAELADLVGLLQDQNARRIDIVAPASKLRSENGVIVVEGTDVELTEEGVTTIDGRYVPTAIFDEGLSNKLGIPLPYVRRMRNERPDLYDANLNGWLRGQVDLDGDFAKADPDSRKFLIRAFRGDDGDGIARAFLSDSYKVIDNLDCLSAALDGVRQSGAHIEIDGCDLTDRRMYVRIKAPEVQALAPTLLQNYRSPFSGNSGAENPTVFAGFVISNSETGNGSFSITPRLIVQVCSNGMTLTKDVVRAVHLGGKMDEGLIQWSEDTQRKQLELITSKARDAVATFLDVSYVESRLAEIEQTAATPLTESVKVVENVGKRLFTEEQTAGILDHFIKGGDITAGGVMHAVTSFAQTVTDADTANELEGVAIRAMELAAASV